MDIHLKQFHLRNNATGMLTFLEGNKDIPFDIKRVYYIYGVQPGERRGFHAHKKLEQYLICVSGSCKVLLNDAVEERIAILSNPNEGLYVGPGIWHEMFDFSDRAVLLVLASDYYDESDYIRDFTSFKDYMAGVRT